MRNLTKQIILLLMFISVGFGAKAVDHTQSSDSLKVHYSIYYDWNEVYANESQMATLHAIGKWLQTNDLDVVLIGSSDSRYNEEGSIRVAQSRAEAVAEWLERKYEISPERITIKNGGVDTSTDYDKARRVDVAEVVKIVVAPAKKQEPKPQPEPTEEVVPEEPKEEPKPEVIIEPEPIEMKYPKIALRSNLARIATATADLGVEWRITPQVSIVAHGTYTNWDWNNYERRYALWQVSPEVRYYFDEQYRWYGGLAYQTGEFDYKLGDNGYQSTKLYQTMGVVAGYNLPLNDCLSLDLGIGAGYTIAPYDRYNIQNNVRVRTDKGTKNYWGVNHLSVTLSWNLLK